MYWLSHMSLWGRFFTSYGLQMVEKNFLKEIIWLFDVSIEFTYRNQVLENIQTLQVKKKGIDLHPICKKSELFYNFNTPVLPIPTEQWKP